MIEDYVSKTATLRRATGETDEWGNALFDEVEIEVRWETGNRMTRDTNGNLTVSTARIFTEDPVALNDTIIDLKGREWPVVDVQEHEFLEEFSHYVVVL